MSPRTEVTVCLFINLLFWLIAFDQDSQSNYFTSITLQFPPMIYQRTGIPCKLNLLTCFFLYLLFANLPTVYVEKRKHAFPIVCHSKNIL